MKEMRNIFKTGTVALLGAWMTIISGCGGNSTPVGITVFPINPTILLGKPVQFSATVTGAATTTVTWQICLPPSPTNLQPTNGFLVVATSTIQSTAFATTVVTISSGIGVTVTPTSASLAVGEHQQFLASVNGGTASGSNVTWEVNGVAGGSTADGFICPSASLPANCTAGEYFAPTVAPSGAITITAVSAADPSKEGQATVTIAGAADPTLTSMSPNTVGEGSVQQDVYLSGTNFLTTSTVLAGNPLTPVPTTFISAELLRATI